MKDGQREFLDTYRSVRKKMPPPEKVIKPKVRFEGERFDWKREMEEAENEQREINRNLDRNDSDDSSTGSKPYCGTGE